MTTEADNDNVPCGCHLGAESRTTITEDFEIEERMKKAPGACPLHVAKLLVMSLQRWDDNRNSIDLKWKFGLVAPSVAISVDQNNF